MNPCPCGYLGHPSGKCHCTRDAVLRYQDRISGPLLDRIDMHIEVAALPPDKLATVADGETSEAIAARVAIAYDRQIARQRKPNQQMTTRDIDSYCRLDVEGEQMLRHNMLKFHWSARAYHRVLKVSRTIADLAGSESIKLEHVKEAIQCRRGLQERT